MPATISSGTLRAAITHGGPAVSCRRGGLRAAKVALLSVVLSYNGSVMLVIWSFKPTCIITTDAESAQLTSVLRVVGRSTREARSLRSLRAVRLLLRVKRLRVGRLVLAPLDGIVSNLFNSPHIKQILLTLHFKGRPLTLYPFIWQMAIAAFSCVSILIKAKPRSAWNRDSTTNPKFWNRGTTSV